MARLRVEVVCATPAQQEVVSIEVEEGATALDAWEASGLAGRHPEVAGSELKLGIFGKGVKPAARLQDGDRVEAYRPLQVNPKEARREKASSKRRGKR
jgi:putative ubiquitin-RnfH superfamily antitoxin RatB of RatAB toxin-antitoxin module